MKVGSEYVCACKKKNMFQDLSFTWMFEFVETRISENVNDSLCTGVKCWRKWESWRTNFRSHVDKSCFRLTFYKHSPVASTDIGLQLRKVKISKLWYGVQESADVCFTKSNGTRRSVLCIRASKFISYFYIMTWEKYELRTISNWWYDSELIYFYGKSS